LRHTKYEDNLPDLPSEIRYWRTQYYAIWKVWFLRPTDIDILSHDCSQIKMVGYSSKRKEELYKSVRQNNNGSLEAKLDFDFPYKLNTRPSLIYLIKKKEEHDVLFDRRNRKKAITKENDNDKIEDNILYDITESLKKKKEYLIFKPIPMQANEIYLLEIEVENKTMNVLGLIPTSKRRRSSWALRVAGWWHTTGSRWRLGRWAVIS